MAGLTRSVSISFEIFEGFTNFFPARVYKSNGYEDKKEERRKKKEEESGDLCEYKELFHGDWEEWTSSSAAL